jgi:voltage-gated potassium channel
MNRDAPPQEQEESERYQALHQLEDWLETPVMILGALWLVLLVVELIWGLNPFLNTLVYLIWGVFVVDFIIRLFLAPKKVEYLKQNWLTVLSLFVPALRIGRLARLIRLFRLSRAAQGLRLVKVVASLNRGMNILRNTMRRRGFGYVMLLTLIVILVGAAGMYAFEQPSAVAAQTGQQNAEGLQNYSEALWWTAMVVTTMGSQYWPQTGEGRLLTLLLSIYGFAIFGYVTATLATFFLGSDQQKALEAGIEASPDQASRIPATGNAQDPGQVEQLNAEISALRREVAALMAEIKNSKGPNQS